MCEWLKEIMCKDYKNQIEEWKIKADTLQVDVNKCETSLNSCQTENDNLKSQLTTTIPSIPSWLDITANTYKPSIQVEGINLMMIDPRDIYATSVTLENIVKEKGWLNMGHDAKLTSIWNYVINALTYQYDQSENWQFPMITVRRRQGDCEDGSILFVTLCKLAKVPADKVFNCVGFWNTYYHSFPVAQLENGSWYIFESTLDNYPTNGPMLFKGSNYEASGGVSNWVYSGGIKDATKQV